MEYVEDNNFRVFSPGKKKNDRQKLQDFIKYADDYHGTMVYIVDAGPMPIEPFSKSNKFYYNNEGSWYESPFGG